MSAPPLSEDDLAKVKYAATCMCRDNPCRCTRGVGPVMTLRLVAEIERLRGNDERTPAAALMAAADEIERELICCDEFGMHGGERDHKIRHHICYWSDAARAIVLKHAAGVSS